MTFQQAIIELANGNRSDEAIGTVAGAVSSSSQRGQWYDGPNSTNIQDWITDGRFTGNETVKSLAQEWDN